MQRSGKRARWTPGLRLTHAVFQFDALEALQLIRFWRNRVAPISRIPPEILVLLPDFWDGGYEGVIALTHVCRAWRAVFTSRSSLWTNLNCVDLNKTEVYLERSNSLLINLSLDRDNHLSPFDPFFQVIPNIIGRLKSLSVYGTPENLQLITAHLSQPAPHLERLSIHGGCNQVSPHSPTLTPALFNGDLSSLRKLCVEYICTELPWRNMINLASFILTHTTPDGVSITQFLDFFESAPNLRTIDLYSAAPTSGIRNRRLVSLVRLEWMYTAGGGPYSLLLNHLLIPAGARLTTEVELPSPAGVDPPLRFLDNLRNLHNFTTVQVSGDNSYPRMQFSGPNGEVGVTLKDPRVNGTHLVLGSLARFDTTKTERLEIVNGNLMSNNHLYHALLPMKDLRTLTLSQCRRPHIFVCALNPTVGPSRIMVSPKLEELVIILDREEFDIRSVIEAAEVRALGGAPLRTIRVVDRKADSEVDPADLLELGKCVLDVVNYQRSSDEESEDGESSVSSSW